MATRPTLIKPTTPAAAAPHAKRKPTTTQAPGLDKPHAADIDEDDVETLRQKLMAQFKLTWTRERVVAMVLGIVTAVASGLLLSELVSVITIAVLATSTSAFLAMLIAVLGYALVAYTSGVLGGVVYEYVACGAAREHVKTLYSYVSGLFGAREHAVS
jgi:hypothetical protein